MPNLHADNTYTFDLNAIPAGMNEKELLKRAGGKMKIQRKHVTKRTTIPLNVLS